MDEHEKIPTIAISEDITDSWMRCKDCGRKLFWLEWAIFASIVIVCPSCKSKLRICLGTVVEGLDRKEEV